MTAIWQRRCLGSWKITPPKPKPFTPSYATKLEKRFGFRRNQFYYDDVGERLRLGRKPPGKIRKQGTGKPIRLSRFACPLSFKNGNDDYGENPGPSRRPDGSGARLKYLD